MAVILASTSKIRRSMLKAAGVNFTSRSPGVDEAAIKSQENLEPGRLANRLAEAKAQTISNERKDCLVIGADQVLALGDMVLDKPRDVAQAREHLAFLRGKTHLLHSAVTCARAGRVIWTHGESARMTMRSFSDAVMESYISQRGEGITSSVGAYRIEDSAIQLFERIEGSYFTVLGLPLLPLLGFLREQGELLQ